MRISSYELNVNVHVYEGCDENTCLQKSSPRPPSLPSATIFESTPILVTAKSSKTLTLISQLNPSFLLRLFAPSGALSINCIASSLKRDLPGGPLNLKRTILPMAASQPQGQEDSPLFKLWLTQWGYIPPSVRPQEVWCPGAIDFCVETFYPRDNVEDGMMMMMVTGMVWVVCSLPRISSRLTALPPYLLARSYSTATQYCKQNIAQSCTFGQYF